MATFALGFMAGCVFLTITDILTAWVFRWVMRRRAERHDEPMPF